MDEVQGKIEMWIKLIESEKLQDVSKDIQMSICARLDGKLIDDKLNDSLFKLLLRLCRVADKCHKQNRETGKDISKLANLLCSLLIGVPEGSNFIKALFKIIRCLISLDLHEDAVKICYYLQPDTLYCPQGDTIKLLLKVLSLWRVLVNNVYLTFANESFNAENYNKLKSVIKYEMKLMTACETVYQNYTMDFIVGISKHLNKVSAITKDRKYSDDFCKYMLEFLAEVQLNFVYGKDEKYIIYCHILHIMSHVISNTINTTSMEFVVKTLDKLFSYFKNLLKKDKECCECFQQFQSFCMTLLVPMENLVSDSAKNIQDIIYCNSNIAQKYGYAGGLKWNALSIAEIAELVFTYWEKCVETDKNMLERLIDTGILLELMNLFMNINVDEFYIKQVSIKCKWCLNKQCTVKRDLYNAIVLKNRCVCLVCKFPVKTLPAEVCALTRKLLKQNVESIIREMKECECKRWSQSWNTCRNLIYNAGVVSEHVYEESVYLYSFLCTCIFQLDGIESRSIDLEDSKNLENIISFALRRLSVVYYNNNMYRKAMTVCALNALLTCNQASTKAFHTWINIKQNAPEGVANLTMLECLTNDKNETRSELGFSIDTSKYDLTALCLREATSLMEKQIAFTNGVAAVLETLRKLQSSNQYAHTVHLLGYYLLGFKYDSSILEYYEQAIRDLKQDKSNSVAVLCLEVNLSFFMFVDELHMMSKQTRTEMEKTKFALCAPKLQELAETKSPNVVPAYTMINVKKDTNLMLCLQKCLKKWKQLFKCCFKEIVKDWEPELILSMLITAGEYARLYRYEDCEADVWTLAYKLALETNDYRIIYITSRCISLRRINYDWITIAQEYVIKHRDSKDEDIIRTIAIFWISLADLYFECEKYDDAKQLLTEARSLSGISFHANKSVHLLSLDVVTRNCHFYDMQHEDYTLYVEENRLTMRSLNQDLLTTKWTNQMKFLFSYDVLFTTAVNLSIRLNSLLSFRGISPDLVLVLKSAQSLNAMLRTAEILKSMCYIDLSRFQLDDCEVKLQGLEHMLNIETFQLSMESKSIEIPLTHLAVTPTKIMDPVRDTPQNDASPVLGKKVFDLPKFALHTDCDCYKCGNISYQYMVFVTTYIRAQLYALQNHTAAALDHFYGAFKIRQGLFEEEKSVLPENWPCNEIGVKRLSWQIRFYIIDYIQLLIDFCYFLKTKIMSRQENVIDIINLAINTCCKYKLELHPVYEMAKELALDNELQRKSSHFSLKFMVPQPHDIDISNHAKISIDPSVCVTPTQNPRVKKPGSVRRRKSPVALKITKVNMIWSDDEDDDSLSPPPPAKSNQPKSKSRTNLVRRKILEEDLADDIANLNIKDSASKETKLKNMNEDRNSMQNKSIRDIMIKVTSLVPDISEHLNLVDETNVPATMENIDKLIEDVKNLKIKPKTRKRIKDMKQLTDTAYNEKINQAIKFLKEIKENINENIDSSMPTNLEKVEKLQIQKTPSVHNEKKFFKNRLLKDEIENPGTSSTNESKNSRTISKYPNLLLNENRSTRSSARRPQKKKAS